MRKGELTNPTGAHISEDNFRRFESVIAEFISTYPQVYTFTPTFLRATTATARLRDAVNGFLTHSYPSSLVDPNALRSIWPNVIVIQRGDAISIGEKSAIYAKEIHPAGHARTSSTLTVENPTVEELRAFATLFQTQRLPLPVTFSGIIPLWTPPLGIVFEQQPNATFIML